MEGKKFNILNFLGVIKKLVLNCFFFKFMIVLQTGTCALFFAAQGGFLDIVRVLLDSGASLDLASYVSLH